MASTANNGFGWRQEEEEDEEEDEEEGEEVELEEDTDPSGGRLLGHMDRWNISSSSQEILEDIDLLQELKDYQDLLEEHGEDYDFGELSEFEGLGKANPRSPQAEYLEGDETPEDLSPLSYWRPKTDQQLDFPEDNQDISLAQDVASDGEASRELSFEGQYGSEFSTSPEAQRDPLTSYQHRRSYILASDGGEEDIMENPNLSEEDILENPNLSEEDILENPNLSPSPSGTPLQHTRLKIDVFKTQGPHGDSQELSSPLGRDLRLSCPPPSMTWSRSSFADHIRNSPSVDPEMSSWVEAMGQPMMTAGETFQKEQYGTLVTAQPGDRCLDLSEALETPPALSQVHHRRPERSRKLKAGIAQGLPSKFSRQSRSLSPPGRTSRRKAAGEPDSSPPILVMSNAVPYGRGQLNYPLPDLSKVEPRVRFPTQRYHPPRGKTLLARSKDPGKPVIFKSPAEIVREVLLSSGEGSPQQHAAAPTVSVIPEELKSPRQATELVHQLQEDYHKLLTKYAEAENTIDRLRLGEKVRLYADPPQPSYMVQMGTVSPASKVMTLSLPQVRTSEVMGMSSPALEPAQDKGFSGQPVVSSSGPSSVNPGILRMDSSPTKGNPFTGDELMKLLALQAKKFQSQVESLKDLIQTGRLTPEDQRKVFARLKDAQGALEQAYRQARDQHRMLQKQQGPTGMLGDFDPDRAVEGEIFHLEMRLEELKERLGQAAFNQSNPVPTTASSAHFPEQSPEAQMGSPTPSLHAPIPAVRTPYPEVSNLEKSHYRVQVDVEVSSVSDEMSEGGLPEPLRHMQLQVEKDFDHLLGHYSSFKSLPAALSLERLDSDEHHLSPEETDGATDATNPGNKKDSLQTAAKTKKAPRIPSSSSMTEAQQSSSRHPLPRNPRRPAYQIGHAPTAQPGTLAMQEESSEKSRASGAVRKKMSSKGPPEQLSTHSSMVSVAGSALSERIPRKTNMALSEDLRIVSPETDSGFVGSEASRVSPLAQRPKQRLSHLRSHGILGESAPQDGVQQPAPQWKRPIVMEPLRAKVSPRDRSSEDGPQRQTLPKRGPFRIRSIRQERTNSIASEMEPGTESSHTNSDPEAEPPGEHGTCNPPPSESRHSVSPSSSSLTCGDSLLDSRLKRDQAIADLQNEVSHLRQSLDETLHGPYGYPKHFSSPRASKLQPPLQGMACFSTRDNPVLKTSGKNTAKSESLPPTISSEERVRRTSLPQSGTQDNPTSSKLDSSTPKPQKQRQKEASTSETKPSKQTILRGPYTGTPYAFTNPEPQGPRIIKGTSSCSRCQEAQSHLGDVLTSDSGSDETEGGNSQRDPFGPSQHTTQKKTEAPRCLFCKETGKHKTKAHGQNHAREDTLAQDFGAQQKPVNHRSSRQPGLWHTAVPSQAPTVGYIPTIPLAAYPLSSIIYCPPVATTSTSPSPLGLPIFDHGSFGPLKTWAYRWRPQSDPDCDNSLQDLNWSLNRAVEVAKDMKLTARRMSRTLTWELNKAKSLRGSCLF
nr:PREDICTED: AT-hook-containing transcription factor isoform X2 [Anolis carolinensis]|eukprot:XP_008122428.1 PREDICTED: AT-hook-containing transcription factor isoform X2 [Anolis carolinensis]